MQISTDTKQCVIVFKDGSYKYISQKHADNLMVLSAKTLLNTQNVKTFQIDGGSYDFVMISKIIPYSAFCEEYPNKIKEENERYRNSAPRYDLSHEELRTTKPVNKGIHKEVILKGLREYIEKNETTGKAERLLEALEKKTKYYQLNH